MKGYWKFQNINNMTKATVGNDLILVGTQQKIAGPTPKDTAVRIAVGSYYKCVHNIAPNGGGDSVNAYSLMFDFKILNLKKWHTFFQTDTTNKNDGECFIRPINSATPGTIGVGATGYSNDTVIPNKWYRLVISVSLGHFYRYYLNGRLIHEGDTQDIDNRFSLNPQVLLFADDNQEDDTIDIASVAVFDTCLNASEISKIGTIDPCVLFPMTLSLGKDTTICGINTLTKALSTGNYSYQWSTGETTSSATFSMSKNGSGLKTITVKQTDANGCFLLDTLLLGIYSQPTVNLGKDTGFCEGQKTKLIAGSASNNTYIWQQLPSGKIVSKVNNLTIDSTGSFMVTMSNQFGCSDLDTINITVYPNPAKPSITSNKKDLCLGDSATLSGPAAYKYLWNKGQTSRNISIKTSGSLSLIVRDIQNCQSPASDSISITVHQLPANPILQFNPDTAFCQGDSTLLFVPNNFVTYTWNDGVDKASRWIKNTGSFKLSVTDQYGCVSGLSNTIRMTVFLLPAKPEIERLGPANVCVGDTIGFNSKTTAFWYEWNNAIKTKNIIITQSGNFRLRVRNANNCLSVWSDSLGVTFNPIPTKPLIMPLGKDSLSSSLTAKRYQWLTNGNAGNDSLKSIKAIHQSNYRLRISNDFCWSAFSDSFHFEKSAIRHASFKAFNLSISPNPAKDFVSFKLVNTVDQEINRLVILDVNGKHIFQSPIDIQSLENGISLDLSTLPAGVYFIQMSGPQGIYIRKFVLQ